MEYDFAIISIIAETMLDMDNLNADTLFAILCPTLFCEGCDTTLGILS